MCATIQIIGLTNCLIARIIICGVLLGHQDGDGLRETNTHRVGIEDGQKAHNGQYHTLW